MPPKTKLSMTLAGKLKAGGLVDPVKSSKTPLWGGPIDDGVTFSMLAKFLTCRERFRVRVIEGLKPHDQFSHRIEYGQMWHTCEEYHAKNEPWEPPLRAYCVNLANKYPMAREQINHWWSVCKVQYPMYVAHWQHNEDVKDRTPVFQEKVFSVPYLLPSGRTVRLRGKMDGVDQIGTSKSAGLYLFETKTKGDVDSLAIQRQLTSDLQTMIYLTALTVLEDRPKRIPIKGVRYNVIKRPLSGGAGSIRQHKGSKNVPAETSADFYARLGDVISEQPDEFFYRWKVDVTPSDIERFRHRTLTPILEQVCDWYDHVSDMSQDPFRPVIHTPVDNDTAIHWLHPFGADNAIDLYGASDVDEYITSGSLAGLARSEKMFGELA